MKERPILFSGPMVRAILEGRKTQTRRVVKGRSLEVLKFYWGTGDEPDGSRDLMGQAMADETGLLHIWCNEYPSDGSEAIACPYGAPGDRLWVRETWALANRNHWPDLPHTGSAVAGGVAYYRESFDRSKSGMTWKPSIHMPRWASRLSLEVTGIRVERLQDISKEDCEAEGIHPLPLQKGEPGCWWTADLPDGSKMMHGRTPVGAFTSLWCSINGPESWDSNPWVWVVEFKRIEANAKRGVA